MAQERERRSRDFKYSSGTGLRCARRWQRQEGRKIAAADGARQQQQSVRWWHPSLGQVPLSCLVGLKKWANGAFLKPLTRLQNTLPAHWKRRQSCPTWAV